MSEWEKLYHQKKEIVERMRQLNPDQKEIHRLYQIAWRKKHLDTLKEKRREYEKRPDVKEKIKAYRNAYNKSNPEKIIKQRITTYKNFLEKHGYKVIEAED